MSKGQNPIQHRKEAYKVIGFAAIGMVLICGGSFSGIMEPGADPTGTFLFETWGLGALSGIGSIMYGLIVRVKRTDWLIVAALAFVAIGSVIWTLGAMVQDVVEMEISYTLEALKSRGVRQ